MLLNVLIVILTAYVMATPYFYAKAVKFGLKLAQDPEKASEAEIFHVPRKPKDVKMTAEEKRTVQILSNIDRYDGTSNGQEKVKVNGQ